MLIFNKDFNAEAAGSVSFDSKAAGTVKPKAEKNPPKPQSTEGFDAQAAGRVKTSQITELTPDQFQKLQDYGNKYNEYVEKKKTFITNGNVQKSRFKEYKEFTTVFLKFLNNFDRFFDTLPPKNKLVMNFRPTITQELVDTRKNLTALNKATEPEPVKKAEKQAETETVKTAEAKDQVENKKTNEAVQPKTANVAVIASNKKLDLEETSLVVTDDGLLPPVTKFKNAVVGWYDGDNQKEISKTIDKNYFTKKELLFYVDLLGKRVVNDEAQVAVILISRIPNKVSDPEEQFISTSNGKKVLDTAKLKYYLVKQMVELAQKNDVSVLSDAVYDTWPELRKLLLSKGNDSADEIKHIDDLIKLLGAYNYRCQDALFTPEETEKLKEDVNKLNDYELIYIHDLREMAGKGNKGINAFYEKLASINSQSPEASHAYKVSGPGRQAHGLNIFAYANGLNAFKRKYYLEYRTDLVMEHVEQLKGKKLKEIDKQSKILNLGLLEGAVHLTSVKNKSLDPEFLKHVHQTYQKQRSKFDPWSALVMGRYSVPVGNEVRSQKYFLDILDHLEENLDKATNKKWREYGLPSIDSLNAPELLKGTTPAQQELYRNVLTALQFYFQFCGTPEGAIDLPKWATQGAKEMAGSLFIFSLDENNDISLGNIRSSYKDLISNAVSGLTDYFDRGIQIVNLSDTTDVTSLTDSEKAELKMILSNKDYMKTDLAKNMTSLKVKFLIAKLFSKITALEKIPNPTSKTTEWINNAKGYLTQLKDLLDNSENNFEKVDINGTQYSVLNSKAKGELHSYFRAGTDEKIIKFLNYQQDRTIVSSNVPDSPEGVKPQTGVSGISFWPLESGDLGNFSRSMLPTKLFYGDYWSSVKHNLINRNVSGQEKINALKEALQTQLNLNIVMPLGFKYGLPAKIFADTYQVVLGNISLEKMTEEDTKLFLSMMLYRLNPLFWYDQAFKDLEQGNVVGFMLGIYLANMFTTEGGRNSGWGRFLRLDERIMKQMAEIPGMRNVYGKGYLKALQDKGLLDAKGNLLLDKDLESHLQDFIFSAQEEKGTINEKLWTKLKNRYGGREHFDSFQARNEVRVRDYFKMAALVPHAWRRIGKQWEENIDRKIRDENDAVKKNVLKTLKFINKGTQAVGKLGEWANKARVIPQWISAQVDFYTMHNSLLRNSKEFVQNTKLYSRWANPELYQFLKNHPDHYLEPDSLLFAKEAQGKGMPIKAAEHSPVKGEVDVLYNKDHTFKPSPGHSGGIEYALQLNRWGREHTSALYELIDDPNTKPDRIQVVSDAEFDRVVGKDAKKATFVFETREPTDITNGTKRHLWIKESEFLKWQDSEERMKATLDMETKPQIEQLVKNKEAHKYYAQELDQVMERAPGDMTKKDYDKLHRESRNKAEVYRDDAEKINNGRFEKIQEILKEFPNAPKMPKPGDKEAEKKFIEFLKANRTKLREIFKKKSYVLEETLRETYAEMKKMPARGKEWEKLSEKAKNITHKMLILNSTVLYFETGKIHLYDAQSMAELALLNGDNEVSAENKDLKRNMIHQRPGGGKTYTIGVHLLTKLQMIRAGLYDGLKAPNGQSVSAKEAKLYYTTSFEDLVKQFEGDSKELLDYLKSQGVKVAVLSEDYKVKNELGQPVGDEYLKKADIIISTTQTLATAVQSGNHAPGVFKPGYMISDEADQTKFYQFDINSIISVSNDGVTSPFLAKKLNIQVYENEWEPVIKAYLEVAKDKTGPLTGEEMEELKKKIVEHGGKNKFDQTTSQKIEALHNAIGIITELQNIVENNVDVNPTRMQGLHVTYNAKRKKLTIYNEGGRPQEEMVLGGQRGEAIAAMLRYAQKGKYRALISGVNKILPQKIIDKLPAEVKFLLSLSNIKIEMPSKSAVVSDISKSPFFNVLIQEAGASGTMVQNYESMKMLSYLNFNHADGTPMTKAEAKEKVDRVFELFDIPTNIPETIVTADEDGKAYIVVKRDGRETKITNKKEIAKEIVKTMVDKYQGEQERIAKNPGISFQEEQIKIRFEYLKDQKFSTELMEEVQNLVNKKIEDKELPPEYQKHRISLVVQAPNVIAKNEAAKKEILMEKAFTFAAEGRAALLTVDFPNEVQDMYDKLTKPEELKKANPKLYALVKENGLTITEYKEGKSFSKNPKEIYVIKLDTIDASTNINFVQDVMKLMKNGRCIVVNNLINRGNDPSRPDWDKYLEKAGPAFKLFDDAIIDQIKQSELFRGPTIGVFSANYQKQQAFVDQLRNRAGRNLDPGYMLNVISMHETLFQEHIDRKTDLGKRIEKLKEHLEKMSESSIEIDAGTKIGNLNPAQILEDVRNVETALYNQRTADNYARNQVKDLYKNRLYDFSSAVHQPAIMVHKAIKQVTSDMIDSMIAPDQKLTSKEVALLEKLVAEKFGYRKVDLKGLVGLTPEKAKTALAAQIFNERIAPIMSSMQMINLVKHHQALNTIVDKQKIQLNSSIDQIASRMEYAGVSAEQAKALFDTDMKAAEHTFYQNTSNEIIDYYFYNKAKKENRDIKTTEGRPVYQKYGTKFLKSLVSTLKIESRDVDHLKDPTVKEAKDPAETKPRSGKSLGDLKKNLKNKGGYFDTTMVTGKSEKTKPEPKIEKKEEAKPEVEIKPETKSDTQTSELTKVEIPLPKNLTAQLGLKAPIQIDDKVLGDYQTQPNRKNKKILLKEIFSQIVEHNRQFGIKETKQQVRAKALVVHSALIKSIQNQEKLMSAQLEASTAYANELTAKLLEQKLAEISKAGEELTPEKIEKAFGESSKAAIGIYQQVNAVMAEEVRTYLFEKGKYELEPGEFQKEIWPKVKERFSLTDKGQLHIKQWEAFKYDLDPAVYEKTLTEQLQNLEKTDPGIKIKSKQDYLDALRSSDPAQKRGTISKLFNQLEAANQFVHDGATVFVYDPAKNNGPSYEALSPEMRAHYSKTQFGATVKRVGNVGMAAGKEALVGLMMGIGMGLVKGETDVKSLLHHAKDEAAGFASFRAQSGVGTAFLGMSAAEANRFAMFWGAAKSFSHVSRADQMALVANAVTGYYAFEAVNFGLHKGLQSNTAKRFFKQNAFTSTLGKGANFISMGVAMLASHAISGYVDEKLKSSPAVKKFMESEAGQKTALTLKLGYDAYLARYLITGKGFGITNLMMSGSAKLLRASGVRMLESIATRITARMALRSTTGRVASKFLGSLGVALLIVDAGGTIADRVFNSTLDSIYKGKIFDDRQASKSKATYYTIETGRWLGLTGTAFLMRQALEGKRFSGEMQDRHEEALVETRNVRTAALEGTIQKRLGLSKEDVKQIAGGEKNADYYLDPYAMTDAELDQAVNDFVSNRKLFTSTFDFKAVDTKIKYAMGQVEDFNKKLEAHLNQGHRTAFFNTASIFRSGLDELKKLNQQILENKDIVLSKQEMKDLFGDIPEGAHDSRPDKINAKDSPALVRRLQMLRLQGYTAAMKLFYKQQKLPNQAIIDFENKYLNKDGAIETELIKYTLAMNYQLVKQIVRNPNDAADQKYRSTGANALFVKMMEMDAAQLKANPVLFKKMLQEAEQSPYDSNAPVGIQGSDAAKAVSQRRALRMAQIKALKSAGTYDLKAPYAAIDRQAGLIDDKGNLLSTKQFMAKRLEQLKPGTNLALKSNDEAWAGTKESYFNFLHHLTAGLATEKKDRVQEQLTTLENSAAAQIKHSQEKAVVDFVKANLGGLLADISKLEKQVNKLKASGKSEVLDKKMNELNFKRQQMRMALMKLRLAYTQAKNPQEKQFISAVLHKLGDKQFEQKLNTYSEKDREFLVKNINLYESLEGLSGQNLPGIKASQSQVMAAVTRFY